ncbi:MAG TPA: hypothetical protein VIC59_03925 [Gemmatimonadota bacterium]|jgi:hypothetical protein
MTSRFALWPVGAALLAVGLASAGCVKAYDLVIDNRTVSSLTLRVYSEVDGGKFSQYPDRIFSLPPNREFRLERAIVSTGHGDRRLFEFRRADEQLVDSFVLTYEELERDGGRITVPRSLAGIARDAPPPAGYVDSSANERIDYIPLFPAESVPGAK